MTPEQNPAICAELDHAVELIAKLARHSHVQHPEAGKHDPGQIPGRLRARMSGLVARYGFTMRYADLEQPPGQELLGATSGDWDILPEQERLSVDILRDMSPASDARVMAHEAAHVVLGHVGLDELSTLTCMITRILRKAQTGSAEDPDEEIAAELAAGAFCKVAGIGTGRYSRAYLHQKLGGKRASAEALAAAKLAARILYATARPALTERNAA